MPEGLLSLLNRRDTVLIVKLGGDVGLKQVNLSIPVVSTATTNTDSQNRSRSHLVLRNTRYPCRKVGPGT